MEENSIGGAEPDRFTVWESQQESIYVGDAPLNLDDYTASRLPSVVAAGKGHQQQQAEHPPAPLHDGSC